MKPPKFTGPANPGYIEAMRGLRMSSAADKHTPRPRKGTRRQKELQAIRDSREEHKE